MKTTTCKILLLCISNLLFCSFLAAQNDTQFWGDTWIYLPKFSDQYSAGYVNTVRFDSDELDLVDRRHALFLSHKHSDLVNLSGQFAYIEQFPGDGRPRQKQYRPTIDLHGALNLEDIKFPYRLRVERQFRESREDRWNFRPRIGIEKSFEIMGKAPYIFLSTETFYGSDTRSFYRLRNLAGIGIPVASYLTIELYGGIQLNRDANVADLTLAGLVLKIKP